MRPKSKKRKPKNERGKLLVAVALATVLCGVIFWPASKEGELSSQAEATSSEASASRPMPKRSFSTQASSDAQNEIPAVAYKDLKRLDHKQIATLDPFLIEAENASQITGLTNRISGDSPDSSSSSNDMEQNPQVRVSAVYQTADGAMALIDGKLVPVKDATVLVRTLRSGL